MSAAHRKMSTSKEVAAPSGEIEDAFIIGVATHYRVIYEPF
jgi:hypothetical protein